jgi:hypothetical protein
VILPTFSGLGPAMACAGTVVLPKVGETNEDMERGTGRHRFVALAINCGRETALGDAAEGRREELGRIDLERLLHVFRFCGLVRSEVAYAWDPVAGTARELGVDLGRGYEASGADMTREVCGTLDLYGIARDALEAVVVDMKGRSEGDPWQLRAQALAVARAHGLERVHVAFAHAQEDGGWRWAHVETLDALAMDAAEAAVAGMIPAWERAAVARDWCSSRRYCPAKNALVRAAASLAFPHEVALLTSEERAEAWRVVKRYKPVFDELEKALKESARLEPIDLGDRVVTTVPGNEVIDPSIGDWVLREKYGEKFAVMAATGKITKAGITRAVGAAGVLDTSLTVDAVLDVIREAGGISRGEDKVVEVKRRGALPQNGSER